MAPVSSNASHAAKRRNEVFDVGRRMPDSLLPHARVLLACVSGMHRHRDKLRPTGPLGANGVSPSVYYCSSYFMAQGEGQRLSVVMLPWLAHGHVVPYLELAKRLTSLASGPGGWDVVVHFVSTPVNLAAVKNRHRHGGSDSIRLVELHLPSLLDLPPQLHTTKHLPPHLMPALKHAFDLAEPAFGDLLDAIRPDLVVYDFIQPWAPLTAAARGVPAVHFMTSSAASSAFFVHCLQNVHVPSAFPFEQISLGGAVEDAKYAGQLARGNDGGGSGWLSDRERLLGSLARSSGFVAVKTFWEIERKYIEHLSALIGKEIVPVGPLLSEPAVEQDAGEGSDRVMRWLGEKEAGSVVFASFGSEYFMSDAQTEELARGMDLSGADFIWVVRFLENGGGGGTPTAAVRAFLERARRGGRGLVVEGWAPQRRVLAHRNCGAFLTHCGWSSVMEAMAVGVPMVALPLHIDQPLNANLVAEVGAGVRVAQERFGEFRGEDVAAAIRGVLRGEEGEKARRRARELAEVTVAKDGERQEIVELVEKMARLCGKLNDNQQVSD